MARMPRPLRIIHPGAWYHLTARGIERRSIFLDDRDRAHFLELFAEWTERFALKLHAYVLMDNHYHLLIEPGRPNLSQAVPGDAWANLLKLICVFGIRGGAWHFGGWHFGALWGSHPNY